MTFDAREISNFTGQPALLHDFRRGTAHWRYCTTDRDVLFGGNTYTALAAADGGVVQSGEGAQDNFVVTLPADSDVPQMFRVTPPSQQIHLTVRRWHAEDDEAPVTWIGIVSAVRRTSQVAAEVICHSLSGSLARAGLRLTWARGCPLVLYDRNCRANKALFGQTGTIDSITGTTVVSAIFTTYPNDRFYGGFIEWAVTGGIERRGIKSHVGSAVTLLNGVDGLTEGQTITAYPGCKHTAADCNDFFDNILNNGGFRHIPGKSPFSGDPIF